MNEKQIKKLRKHQIKILDEITRICEEENIKYFLDYGSLIGCIRHNGYIPWDDDIDIGMFRKDYEKFLKIAPLKLKDNFILCYYKNELNSFHCFAKVRLKDTIMLEKGNKNLNMNFGIWVDIFPYDNLKKSNSLIIKLKKKIFDILTTCISIKLGIEYYSNEKKKKILKIILKIFNIKLLYKLREMICKLNKNDNSKYVCCFDASSSRCCDGLLREKIVPKYKSKFENKEYYIPNDYDYRLRKEYGEYMIIPPKEKQITHNPLLIKFEDGETIDFRKEIK